MMTLDEAIEHAEWAANNCEGECSEEHHQLAEWLKELRERQDVDAEMEDERNLLFERLGNCREALTDARAENEKYRELIRILDHDWNIEASWDGLRKFWYVGLTEKGVAERDERDAENAKLRKLVNSYADLFEKEAATNNGHGPYYSGEDWLVLANDMRVELAKCCGELGIEVGE